MANAPRTDLNYGHFGQATYSTENGSWTFDRNPGQNGSLRQLGAWNTVVPPSKSSSTATPPGHRRNIRDADIAANALGRGNPELVPSLPVLSALEITSAAVTDTASTYDSAVGCLLSFGSFTQHGHYKRPRRVAAIPTGECGNILRLVMLTKEKHGWGSDTSIWLEGPSMADAESGYWVEDAAPIQQVCFAEAEDRSTFLAVRFPTKIVLFRPRHHDSRTAAVPSPLYDLPASKVESHTILSITLEQTGGVPHADVTFNPFYQRQLALVDREGTWSIWDIDGGYTTGSRYSASCTILGSLTSSKVQMGAQEPRSSEDGWARILWIGDVNTILVCNRRTLKLFDISGGEPKPLKLTAVIPQRSADWILDLRSHPSNKHQFFVLTSTRLLLMVVTCRNEVSEYGDVEAGAHVSLSWLHFQSPEDITLQISLSAVTDGPCMALLFSRLNNFVTYFQFENRDSNPRVPFSISDPSVANIFCDVLGSPEARQSMIQLHVHPLEFYEYEDIPEHGRGLAYRAEGVRFYRLSIMLSDLSIHHAFLYTHSHTLGDISQKEFSVEPPWSKVVHPYTTKVQSSEVVDSDDEFIRPDGSEGGTEPALKSHQFTVSLQRRRPSSSRNTLRGETFRTQDHSCVYDALVERHDPPTKQEIATSKTEDVSAVIDRVRSLLIEEAELDNVPRGTVLDLSGATITVSDIDEASSKLWDLRLDQIILSLDADEGDVSISSLYDTILQNWIAPLPANAPSRVRKKKERLARRIAAEVMLARSRIHSSSSFEPIRGQPQPELQKGPSQDSGIALPPSSSRPGSSQSDGLAFQSSPPLSSPADPLTRSYVTHPNPVLRLTRHIQIEKPPLVVPRNVDQVLMHWAPGIDPSTYDWEVTERSIHRDLHANEAPSRKEAEKSKRRAERLMKRQRREDVERSKAESQPLYGREEGGLRSSPIPVVPGLGLSSQVAIQAQGQSQSQSQEFGGYGGMVQSQVESGRHGGRPVIKKKKKGKGRVSGF